MNCFFNKNQKINLINDKSDYKGYINTYGVLAATISFDGYQWYAPFTELSESLKEKISNKYTNIYVQFKVNKSKTSGKTLKGPRFYAEKVREYPIKYLENNNKLVTSIII